MTQVDSVAINTVFSADFIFKKSKACLFWVHSLFYQLKIDFFLLDDHTTHMEHEFCI